MGKKLLLLVNHALWLEMNIIDTGVYGFVILNVLVIGYVMIFANLTKNREKGMIFGICTFNVFTFGQVVMFFANVQKLMDLFIVNSFFVCIDVHDIGMIGDRTQLAQ